jgi:hypothetical protein
MSRPLEKTGIEKRDVSTQRINVITNLVLTGLSLAAAVLVGLGYTQRPLDDEGTLAHLFQLSMVALMPAGLLFVVTADWARPAKVLRRLAAPAVLILLAFGGLYYLEHHYYPARYGWHLKSSTP